MQHITSVYLVKVMKIFKYGFCSLAAGISSFFNKNKGAPGAPKSPEPMPRRHREPSERSGTSPEPARKVSEDGEVKKSPAKVYESEEKPLKAEEDERKTGKYCIKRQVGKKHGADFGTFSVYSTGHSTDVIYAGCCMTVIEFPFHSLI